VDSMGLYVGLLIRGVMSLVGSLIVIGWEYIKLFFFPH